MDDGHFQCFHGRLCPHGHSSVLRGPIGSGGDDLELTPSLAVIVRFVVGRNGRGRLNVFTPPAK